jgi:chromosome segregation ATPase
MLTTERDELKQQSQMLQDAIKEKTEKAGEVAKEHSTQLSSFKSKLNKKKKAVKGLEDKIKQLESAIASKDEVSSLKQTQYQSMLDGMKTMNDDLGRYEKEKEELSKKISDLEMELATAKSSVDVRRPNYFILSISSINRLTLLSSGIGREEFDG